MKIDPLTAIDYYKADHRRQYPEGTNMVYSNFTPRSNRLSNLPDNNDKIVFFGLQYFIKNFLLESWNENFFMKAKTKVVADYKRLMDNTLGPDAIPVDHIEALHDLGHLPIEIRALPEGTKVPMNVPVLTIHNTHPDFFWLVNYLETIMSCYLWKACTSATTANWYREFLTTSAMKTVGNADFVAFQGHDFSFRGQGSYQDAIVSGAAHLTSFVGTDTVPAIRFLEQYYGANVEKELVGCSVPATEHSVMCLGTQDGEFETFKRLITEIYPKGIVSIVSDTWDFWQVITDFLPRLKDEIMNRSGGVPMDRVVIRPDSGDPVKIVCGYKTFKSTIEPKKINDSSYELDYDDFKLMDTEIESMCDLLYNDYELVEFDGNYYKLDSYDIYDLEHEHLIPVDYTSAEVKGAIECLWETFGGTINEKGYKELDPHIGLIYGDSITPERCKQIIEQLECKGFASTNIVFGVGSYTYNYVTRDTYGFAVKATYGEVNNEGREIQKSPKTDSGSKKSHCGLLQVVKDYKTGYIVNQGVSKHTAQYESELHPVFVDGTLVVKHTLQEIRNRVKNNT